MFNIVYPDNTQLRTLALAGVLLWSVSALPAAAYAQAPQQEQIIITDEQIKRAGIAMAPALASLPDAPAGAAGAAVVLSGTVVAPTTAVTLSGTAWAGTVQAVHVAPLQVVKPGTALVTLFSQPWMELQREFVAASAQARLAADKLKRDEDLFAEGIISRVRLDETRSAAQLTRLAADLRAQALRAGGLSPGAIKRLLDHADLSPLLIVRAQSAGTVVDVPLAVGQQVDAGMSVAKIVRGGPLWVELQASRQQLASVTLGDRLQVAENCHLKVTAISPLVNGANQTATVRAEQVEQNACLKVNAFVEARLSPPRAQTGYLAVPSGAVVRRGAANYVFIRNAKGFAAVAVQPGAVAGEQIWIKGAISEGMPVAVRGLSAIKGAWAGLGEPVAASAKGQP